MHPKKAAFWNIVVSLVFAAAIILSSYLLRDSDSSQVIMFLLIGLWWIPFTYLTAAGSGRSVSAEVGCVKRMLSGLLSRR